MGLIQRTLVNLALGFIRKTNKGFHFNLKQGAKSAETEEERERGDYEKPHVAFPLQTAVDRLVVSKPGDVLPKLGDGEIYESEQSIRDRKKGVKGE